MPSVDFEKLKEHFGITKNPYHAGYVLPKGEMLDFSGKHKDQQFYRSTTGENIPRPTNIHYVKEYTDREIGHSDIPRHLLPMSGEHPTDIVTRAGAMRVDHKHSIAELQSHPTSEQLSHLFDLAYKAHSSGTPITVDMVHPETKKHDFIIDVMHPSRVISKVKSFYKTGKMEESFQYNRTVRKLIEDADRVSELANQSKDHKLHELAEKKWEYVYSLTNDSYHRTLRDHHRNIKEDLQIQREREVRDPSRSQGIKGQTSQPFKPGSTPADSNLPLFGNL